jgi:hypothetical protein
MISQLLAGNQQRFDPTQPGSGIASAISSLGGALMQRGLNREQEARQQEFSQSLGDVLSRTQGMPEGQAGPPQPLANVLANIQNPDLQQMLAPALLKQAITPPETPEGFTLGPGQRRFTAGGDVIAEAPFKEPEILDPRVQAAKEKIAAAGAARQSVVVGGQKLTPGQKKRDETFATELVKFEDLGGFADAAKGINQLETVSNALASGRNLTGPVIGNIPDAVLSATNPEALNVREQVEEVVQRNLRLILGAQFTEKESERLIRRAYNPNLPEEVNKRRVDALLTQMKAAARQKQEAAAYFNANGTMRGFKGQLPSMDDFDFAISKAEELPQQGQGGIVPTLPQGARQIGTSQGRPVFETPDGRRFIQE